MRPKTATLAGEFTAALHYGPGPHPDGSQQSVHAGGATPATKPAPKFAEPEQDAAGRYFDERPVDWDAYEASAEARLPKSYQTATDGGPGPSLQYHGTSETGKGAFRAGIAFTTDNPEEADGYARGAHRAERVAGERLLVRRAPGKAINVTDLINQVIAAEGDPDAYIAKHAPDLRQRGYSYVFFTHPSFVGDGEQNVLVSLNPQRDLTIKKRQKVKP